MAPLCLLIFHDLLETAKCFGCEASVSPQSTSMIMSQYGLHLTVKISLAETTTVQAHRLRQEAHMRTVTSPAFEAHACWGVGSTQWLAEVPNLLNGSYHQ